MSDKLKVVVAHSGKQHSYKLASALKKSGLLDTYITTIYLKKSSIMMKNIGKLLSEDNYKRLVKRSNQDLQDYEVIQFNITRGLVETALYRIDKQKKYYEIYRQRTADLFGKKVAKYAIKNNVDAVIMYDSNATACFKLLERKAPKIKRILDVSIGARPYLKKIYLKDMEITGSDELIRENYEVFGNESMIRSMDEIKFSQFFLVASDFVEESLLDSGAESRQIYKVPYGVNLNVTSSINQIGNSLIFIFVGQVITRKGVHHLLKAFSELCNDSTSQLWLVGAVDEESPLYKKYCRYNNIHFYGLVTHDKLSNLYSEANIFIMPSLGEGMTLAGLEAMGSGLPIICTRNAGLSDAVEDRINGYIIPESDYIAIKRAVSWFENNIGDIKYMSERSVEKSKYFTWEIYEKKIKSALMEILEVR